MAEWVDTATLKDFGVVGAMPRAKSIIQQIVPAHYSKIVDENLGALAETLSYRFRSPGVPHINAAVKGHSEGPPLALSFIQWRHDYWVSDLGTGHLPPLFKKDILELTTQDFRDVCMFLFSNKANEKDGCQAVFTMVAYLVALEQFVFEAKIPSLDMNEAQASFLSIADDLCRSYPELKEVFDSHREMIVALPADELAGLNAALKFALQRPDMAAFVAQLTTTMTSAKLIADR